MKITLKMKNVTPLCQIEGHKKERINETEVDTITIKTITKLIDDMPVEVPYFTPNSLRGILRRVIGSKIIQKAIEKGIKITPTQFHLMMAGGGSNFQTQPFEIVEKVRKLNPLISVFGTSLAVEGKLMVTGLEPIDPLIRINETKDGEVWASSGIMKKFVFIKRDDILQKTKFGTLLSKEDIIEWEKAVAITQEQRKKEREIEEKKTKKLAIQGIFAKYYIIPSVEFKGFIGEKYQLNEVEEGMLIDGLVDLTKEQLGSTLGLGFGVCDWEIDINDTGSKIVAKSKDDYIFDKDIKVFLSEEDEKKVNKWREWLENLEEENVAIDKVLVA
jgi:CRISPR type IV-associated protein Csf2